MGRRYDQRLITANLPPQPSRYAHSLLVRGARRAKGPPPYQPGAALGICSWVVERRIRLKDRVLPSCHYHMAAFHASSRPKTLIEAVRARRIALKMTLREFSKVIGRNLWAVSEWENGRAVPRQSSRERLLEWLGFDPEATSGHPRPAALRALIATRASDK